MTRVDPPRRTCVDSRLSSSSPQGKLGGAQEECVGGFDLVYNGGPMPAASKQMSYSTRLGCFDDRVRQLKKLHKAHAKRAAAASAQH